MKDLGFLVFIPAAIGCVTYFVLTLGTTKAERMRGSANVKKAKRLKIANWTLGGGFGLTAILFLIFKLTGNI